MIRTNVRINICIENIRIFEYSNIFVTLCCVVFKTGTAANKFYKVSVLPKNLGSTFAYNMQDICKRAGFDLMKISGCLLVICRDATRIGVLWEEKCPSEMCLRLSGGLGPACSAVPQPPNLEMDLLCCDCVSSHCSFAN